MNNDELDKLSNLIIGAAIDVHKTLGPGLLEHAYQVALMCELKMRGINAKAEVEIPLTYKDCKLDTAYRADIIVEDEIILELKATEDMKPVYSKQLRTYLRLANKKLGLLINFNNELLTKGITRVVNGF